MPPGIRIPLRPLRVAVVCGQLEIGGQEAGLVELLRRFDPVQVAVRLYTFRSGPLLDTVRRLGVPVEVGSRRAGSARRWTRADARDKAAFRRRLAEAFRVHRTDVCLIYGWADAVPAAREAGVTAIVERVDGPKLVGAVGDKSSCQRIICESHAIRRLLVAQREWLRCASVPIDVIRNGVELGRFEPVHGRRAASRRALGLGPRDFVVGCVARLAPVKNIGHLLEAARLLLDRVGPDAPTLRVVIAGPEGGAGAVLRRQVRDLGLTSHVRFIGARTDVPRVLSALDVFALPSLQEGTSFALLEAMAAGLPIVTTQADSLVETMQDNGFLVGPTDPYRTMAALRALLCHSGLRDALGQRSRRLSRRHGIEAMTRRYESTLRTAFEAGRRLPAFRRRVAVMSGHAAQRLARAVRPIDRVYTRLRSSGVDAYALGLGAGDTPMPQAWPPRVAQVFPATSEGELAQRTCLEWIRPDVVVTDCPRIVALARQYLPGEEIVYLPHEDHRCAGHDVARRLADRVVPESQAGTLSPMTLHARLPVRSAVPSPR